VTARDVLPILPGSHAVAPPAAAPNRQQSPILPADLTDEEIVGRWLRAKATGRGRLAAMTLAQYRIEAERLFWYAHQMYLRVVDPEKAVIQVARFLEATSQLSQTTLRAILGKHELDELLAERERLNADIQKVLDAQTDAWGIKISNVEIKNVDLNTTMVRAIARQAEAERERRAKIIHAEGELQASEKLLQAAQMLAQAPQAMQLRYLQTLTTIAGDKNSTIVFPMPIDLITSLLDRLNRPTKSD
jgi:hypothetical protein